MAKCTRCGKSGLTLKVDESGFCPSCQDVIRILAKKELEELRRFKEEYSAILPDTHAEAERILADARAQADKIMTEARTQADSIIAEARTQADRITEEARERVDQYRLELEAMKDATEKDIQKAQEKADEKLRKVKSNIGSVTATAEAYIASLLASAADEFAHMSEYSLSKAYQEEHKKKSSSGFSDISLVSLTPSAFKSSAKNGYVVFDLETTGLNYTSDRIIEIGAIKYDGNHREIDRFSTLVNPEKEIPASATAINHITNAMVSGAPPMQDVLPQFVKFVGEYPVVAHNASFDISFLHNAAKRAKQAIIIRYADSLSMARKQFTLSSYRLGNVAEYLGIPVSGAHRSMGDCEMLGAIVKVMLQK